MDEIYKRKLITLPELLELYPFKESTIRFYMGKREFPYYKIGKKTYFRIEDVEEWIDEHKVE